MALDLAVGKRLSEEERIVKVSSCAIVERGSSLSGRSYGKIVTRARDFIRENACTGILCGMAIVQRRIGRGAPADTTGRHRVATV